VEPATGWLKLVSSFSKFNGQVANSPGIVNYAYIIQNVIGYRPYRKTPTNACRVIIHPYNRHPKKMPP
jgi:hypothetical protein